jgi:hypothetical protein
MSSILKVDTIQDQSGNNIINESADTITIGASGDTITIPSGATLSTASFSSTGIDDNADATAITIDSSERVGIGTASPGAKLEIQTGSDWGNIINSTYAGTQYLQQFEYNGTSIGRIRGDNSSISIESGSNLILQTVNTERMRINSTGNVGIGTSSPEVPLSVVGLDTQIHFSESADSGGYLMSEAAGQFRISGGAAFKVGNTAWTAKSTEAAIIGHDSGGDIKFFSNTGLTVGNNFTPTERMRIDGSGNVGIGDTTPSVKLDVNGAIGVGVASAPTWNTGTFLWTEAGIGANIESYTLKFNTGATRNERMRIQPNGNVGIGTNNPTGNLHIDSGTTNGANTLVVESDNTVNGGTVNPVVVIRRNNTGATRLGGIYYQALNSSSAATSYALIEGQVTSDTAGAETGYLRIGVRGSGTLSDCFRFNSGSTLNFMQTGGGIYLGTTSPVAANLLDDYEEGTWTPVYIGGTTDFSSITYVSTSGNYIKVGKLVNAYGRIRTSAVTAGSAAGVLLLGGLPFVINANTALNIGFASNFNGDNPSGGYPGTTGISHVTLNYRTAANGAITNSSVADLNTAAGNYNQLFFSLVYETA